jgi:hypothetical protein
MFLLLIRYKILIDRPLGRFAFESVFPKKYRIVIERDSWCWDKNELIFEVYDLHSIASKMIIIFVYVE